MRAAELPSVKQLDRCAPGRRCAMEDGDQARRRSAARTTPTALPATIADAAAPSRPTRVAQRRVAMPAEAPDPAAGETASRAAAEPRAGEKSGA